MHIVQEFGLNVYKKWECGQDIKQVVAAQFEYKGSLHEQNKQTIIRASMPHPIQ
jgi:hypothetical protein